MSMKEYKREWRKEWSSKYKMIRETQIQDNRKGNGYAAGLVLSLVRSRVKSKNKTRISKGTHKVELRCPYHHTKYFTVLGHSTYRDKGCMMNGKLPDFLRHTRKEIKDDVVNEQMRINIDTSCDYY